MGGIRAQNLRGAAGRNWWSRKWLDAVEHFGIGARLGRGRHYAVSGQITGFTVKPGEMAAVVQGGEKEPYRAVIGVRLAEPEQRQAVLDEIAESPVLLGRLLIHDLPDEIDEIYQKHTGKSLFPDGRTAYRSRCTCRDWANPCKHLAAMYLLFGDIFTRDPAKLLELHGIVIDSLFPTVSKNSLPVKGDETCVVPLSSKYQGFAQFGAVDSGGVIAPLLMRLTAPPCWRGTERFNEVMHAVYTRAATRGRAILDGDLVDFRRPDERIRTIGNGFKARTRHLRAD